ncbi:MAG TPA: dolichol-phosphate mannosyltransferase [Acidimicrobiaceae bacterium]|nr:dolichol-phosphate mannosyltransferase [Acidimicrobiaceae bacterium]
MVAKTVVVLPTYNEADNIVAVLESLSLHAPQVEVLVVDDGSPDGTAELVVEFAKTRKGVFVVRRTEKNGLGDAYRAGFAWAIDHGFEVVVQMDSDLSHDPAAVPQLLARIEDGADLAIGARYIPGGSIPNWSIGRRLLSSVGNRYATLLLGLPLSDVTSGFRAWKVPMLIRIKYGETRSTGYVFLPELAFRAKLAGGRIDEVPIVFRDREQGTSKMSGRIMVESMGRITVWGAMARIRHRQLRIGMLGVAPQAPKPSSQNS